MPSDDADTFEADPVRDDDLNAADIPETYFNWVINGQVIAMHRPTTHDLAALEMCGIDHVISLSEFPLSSEALSDCHLDATHMPVPDMSAPTLKQMDAFVRRLDNLLKTGHKVVVHCGAGLGRTGTMLAAYLVHTGLSAEDALKEVRLRRPGAIESRTQEDAVRDYETHRRKK